MRMLQKVGVAAGPSLSIEEIINDPHVQDRGIIFKQQTPRSR